MGGSGAEFDFIVETSEEFLNRSLRLFYEESIIPRVIEGRSSLGLPGLLQDYGGVGYRIVFTEPLFVDALTGGLAHMVFRADVELVLGVLAAGFRVGGVIEGKPVYDRVKMDLDLNVVRFHLDYVQVLDSVNLPAFIVGAVNDAVRDAIMLGLNALDHLHVSPIVGSLSLPEMPEGRSHQLPVRFGNVEIIGEDAVSLGFDIASRGDGAKTSLDNLSLENDLAVALSQSGVTKVVDFWWPRTTHPMSMPFKGRVEFGNVKEIMGFLSNYSVELLPKLISLGFLEIDYDIVDIWMDYEGVVELSKPAVRLNETSMSLEALALVSVTGFLRVELDVALKFDTSGPIPDFLTPWEDDVVVARGRRVFEVWRYRANKKRIELVDPTASLAVDKEQRIMLEARGACLDVGLGWRLPQRLVERLERNIEMDIHRAFPAIPMSPSVIRSQFEESDLLMELDIKGIVHRDGALIVHADVKYGK